jgi:TonB family protein
MAINRNPRIVSEPIKVREPIKAMDIEAWRNRFAQAESETETQASNSSRRKLWLLATLASACIVVVLALVLGDQRHTTQRVITIVTSSVQRAAERVRQTAKELRETTLGTPTETKPAVVRRRIHPPGHRASVSRSDSDAVHARAESALPKRSFEVWAQDSHREFRLQPVSKTYLVDVEQGRIYRVPVYGDPIRMSSYDAVPTYWTQPQYPISAQQDGLQGVVELRVLIGEDGRVTSVALESGPEILGRAAVEAVRQWRYPPYFYNGRAYAREALIRLGFSLVPQLQTSILKP